MRTLSVTALILLAATIALCQDTTAGEAEGHILIARVIWPDQDLSRTAYHVFADEARRELVDVFPATNPEGAALLALRPGQYWIQAVVDVNGNDVPDAGDGLGWYGVNELSREARPQPLQVRGPTLEPVVIPILVRIAEGGGLEALPWAQARRPAVVSGNITGAEGEVIVALLSTDEDRQSLAQRAQEDGSFALKVLPGSWRLLIAADRSGDGLIGPGDLIAMRGFDGEPLNVEPGQDQALGEIPLLACVAAPPDLPAIVGGRITGASIPEGARVRVSFCADATMRGVTLTVDADSEGRFLTVIPAAVYYLRAVVDLVGEGALSAGDLLGFFGVADLLGDDEPQPLVLSKGALRTDADIAITARLDEDGRLVTWSEEADADTNAPVDAAGE